MTLKEWSKANSALPTHPTTETGAVSVACTEPAAFAELSKLTDYRLDSRYGAICWLLPRQPEMHGYCPDCGRHSLRLIETTEPDHVGEYKECLTCDHCDNMVYIMRGLQA